MGLGGGGGIPITERGDYIGVTSKVSISPGMASMLPIGLKMVTLLYNTRQDLLEIRGKTINELGVQSHAMKKANLMHALSFSMKP